MLVMLCPFFGRFLLSLRSVQPRENIYFVPLVSDSRPQDREESGSRTVARNPRGGWEETEQWSPQALCSIPHCVVPENI